MGKIYALYNPLASNMSGQEKAFTLSDFFPKNSFDFFDIRNVDFADFSKQLKKDDTIIVCGGDGTLNRFINSVYDLNLENEILYYATGTGNDFLRDIGTAVEDGPVKVNDYISNLPVVTVNGNSYRFINGVGYGIDGYCCEVGDNLRIKGAKKINYSSIAIKGLLFHYKPTNATVTVDGVSYKFKKVWIAPTMSGRYYGGGMNPAPGQHREDRQKHVSLSLLFGSGKLKTLMMFPSLFKGEHIKYENNVKVFEGKHITVEFDRPTPLQIDGETILNVSSYEAFTADEYSKLKNTITHTTV